MDNVQKITVTTNDLYTVGNAAKLLGVTRMTVYRWINDKKVLSVELGGVTFVPRCEVKRIVAEVAAEQKNVG